MGISQCGIPVEQEVTTFPCSPANSINSDMETHQSLIEELEDFFGSPTNIESEEGCTCPMTRTSPSLRKPSRVQFPPPASQRTAKRDHHRRTALPRPVKLLCLRHRSRMGSQPFQLP